MTKREEMSEEALQDPVGLACSTIKKFANMLKSFSNFEQENRERESSLRAISRLKEMIQDILEYLKLAKRTEKKCLPREIELFGNFLENELVISFIKELGLITDSNKVELLDYFRTKASYPARVLKEVERLEKEQKERERIGQMMRDAREKILLNRPINNWLLRDEARKNELSTLAKKLGYEKINLKEYPHEYLIE